MEIRVVLDCEESFKKKAAYTFETLFQLLGLRPHFSEAKEFPAQDIIVWYGREQPETSTRLIFIEASSEAASLFREERRLDAAKVRKFVACGEEGVALFYDDEFRRNPTQVSSGDGAHRSIHVDIIASAFHFLSCWQEITSTERDRHERFPASASLQHQLGLLDVPIVNHYAEVLRSELEKLLGHSIEQRPRYAGKLFAVSMTHDIDYIRKWTSGILYREFVQYLLLGRANGSLGKRLQRLGAFLKAVSARSDPYRSGIEKIVNIEKDASVHATYFFKTGVTSRHDVSYRIKDGYVRKLLNTLDAEGHEIGLHPSYHTFLSVEKMREEKAKLDNVIEKKSLAVRQHFLRFRVPQTWRIQAQLGFHHDSTLGFSDHEGFRAGICHPFRSYDVERDEPINIWEVPLVAMDGTFQSYRDKSAEEGFEIIKTLIMRVKRHHGVAVLLFHNTCYDNLDFPGWGRVFEESLQFAAEEGAFVGSAGQVLDSYLASSSIPNGE